MPRLIILWLIFLLSILLLLEYQQLVIPIISTYEWPWEERVFGKHTIKAVAYDNAENSTSDEILVWKFF
jgi:hypothetical protein